MVLGTKLDSSSLPDVCGVPRPLSSSILLACELEDGRGPVQGEDGYSLTCNVARCLNGTEMTKA
jgi:hypothetical protein